MPVNGLNRLHAMTARGYAIRRTLESDAALLPDVERSAAAAFLSAPGLAWIATDSLLSEEQHLGFVHDNWSWVAAGEDGLPLAFLAAGELGGNLHIWEIAVRHDAQGCGIGRALIETAAGKAKNRALPALTLTTFSDVPWNAPFYERCGFALLNGDTLTDALRALLEHEMQVGLPADRRCAMLRKL